MESGPADGAPVLLLHGFPYDVHAFDAVGEILVRAGCRVLVPCLRGFGPTRFLSGRTPRSGQQAALGHDLLDFMDALSIRQATLAGFDWGGRAACITAALWPQRVRGLVTFGGYNIQDIAAAGAPEVPEDEHRMWYQYYFHGERGRPACSKTVVPCAGCCGSSGHPSGTSPMRNTTRARQPSTIPISSTS